MVTKLTRLTQKIAIQLRLMAENCTVYSSRSRRPVRKLLNKRSYFQKFNPIYRTFVGPQKFSECSGEDKNHSAPTHIWGASSV